MLEQLSRPLHLKSRLAMKIQLHDHVTRLAAAHLRTFTHICPFMAAAGRLCKNIQYAYVCILHLTFNYEKHCIMHGIHPDLCILYITFYTSLFSAFINLYPKVLQ